MAAPGSTRPPVLHRPAERPLQPRPQIGHAGTQRTQPRKRSPHLRRRRRTRRLPSPAAAHMPLLQLPHRQRLLHLRRRCQLLVQSTYYPPCLLPCAAHRLLPRAAKAECALPCHRRRQWRLRKQRGAKWPRGRRRRGAERRVRGLPALGPRAPLTCLHRPRLLLLLLLWKQRLRLAGTGRKARSLAAGTHSLRAVKPLPAHTLNLNPNPNLKPNTANTACIAGTGAGVQPLDAALVAAVARAGRVL